MSDPKPTTPECIAKALAALCSKHAYGVISGPAPDFYDWRPSAVPIDVLAQAVWDALLNEGQIRYAPCEPDEATMRRIVPTFDAPNEHSHEWCRVLVVPLLGATRTKDTTDA